MSVSAVEAGAFAESVAGALERHPPVDPWRPGAAADDRDAALDAMLAGLGWDELGSDPRLLAIVAPAAAALGAAHASLAPVDRLLGGGALCAAGLVRYASGAADLAVPQAGRLERRAPVGGLAPRAYGDALGVAAVADTRPAGAIEGDAARARMDAWIAASAGYLDGMTAAAVRLALGHALARRAFGRPLAALEPVQQMLADAATLSRGLELLSAAPVSAAALSHAADAAVRATATCHQVLGAAGFTLELPLQRAYRRARSMRAWTDAVLDAWEET